MAKRRVSLTHRKQRSILTDMLPFEVPPTFSNRGFYRFLRENSVEIEKRQLRWICETDALDRTMRLVFGINPTAMIATEVVMEWGKQKNRRCLSKNARWRPSHSISASRTIWTVEP
mgnify:CR=1 FL=1